MGYRLVPVRDSPALFTNGKDIFFRILDCLSAWPISNRRTKLIDFLTLDFLTPLPVTESVDGLPISTRFDSLWKPF